MAIYAISDLHLSFSTNKPMSVFGSNWEGYEERLRENWKSLVSDDDVVLLPGDISWATYVEDAKEDFAYIHSLPGTKIITKGNHDYWWETLSKLNLFLDKYGFSSIRFLHNNVMMHEGTAILGTKGYPETENGPQTDEEKKLYNRELGRLDFGLKEAKKLSPARTVAMLHYPPGAGTEFARLLQEAGTDICVFGHLHAKSSARAVQGNVRGAEYRLVSCDYLKFTPLRIV